MEAEHGSLDLGVLREVTTEFTVDARSLTATGGNHVTARVLNPSGAKTDTYVTDNGDGTYRVQYTAYEEGKGRAWTQRAGWAQMGRCPHGSLWDCLQVCIWWRCSMMTLLCPRAPSEWV